MDKHMNRIGSEWTVPHGEEYFENRNPADPHEILGLFPLSGVEDADAAIEAASDAFGNWTKVTGPARGSLLNRFADLLEQNVAELAEIVTREQGKAYADSAGEVRRAVQQTRF